MATLATNALVFVLVALFTPRIVPRGAAPQPA